MPFIRTIAPGEAITGFFAYYNRLADGLGIDPEP
jgi:hypothetical protein